MALALERRVLSFWFKDFNPSQTVPPSLLSFWFQSSPETDAEIRTQFGPDIESFLSRPNTASLDASKSSSEPLEELSQTAKGTLAAVLILDQFTRNCYRKSPRAFSGDSQARQLCLQALDRGFDQSLHPVESVFLYLPLEHSESLQDQDRCVQLMRGLVDRARGSVHEKFLGGFVRYAEEHRDIVARFGRFPHRNEVLGRSSTAAETAYLASGGARFGQ